MKIGEFFVELGAKSDNKSVREFAKSIIDLPLQTAVAIGALAGLEYSLVKVAGEAMNAAVGFQMFNAQTGLSWQELQKWQIVAQQVNVSADSMASSISNVQRQMAEIRLGRGNIAPYQMLGIDNAIVARGDAFALLRELRTKMNVYDPATTTNLITQMGFTPDMINVLRLSNEEFSRLDKTITGLSTHQEKLFLGMRRDVVQFGLMFKQYGIDMVTHFVDALGGLDRSIAGVRQNWLLWVGAVVALAVAFAPVTAAIVGLLLLLDDLAVYATGGKSLTGLAAGALGNVFGKGVNAAGAWQQNNLPPWLTGLTAGLGSTLAGSAGPAQVTNNFSTNVNGNGSPVDIAAEVVRQIERHFGRAEQQVNNQGH